MNQSYQDIVLDNHVDTCARQYEPSVASCISSAQTSVFSDASSTQSSIASSVSDDFRLAQDDLRDRAAIRAYNQQQQQAKALAEQTQYLYLMRSGQLNAPSYAEVTSVPQEQRQHPRRSSLARDSRPPSLVRQCERKVNFVDNLVDSATQMVEVIWPLSVAPSHGEGVTGKGVLPLRTYIEETLRRSRTSYSTLQVALYYLVLIKPHVPCGDFTMEQKMDCAADRALMCGRRMFLAALILASKYLQDRNYSAKAWSKMSGLKINEINMNEKTFLAKVNWKLHIPEALFKTWTEVVLRYTPNTQSLQQGAATELAPTVQTSTWKVLVPLLTPELENIPAVNDEHTLRRTAVETNPQVIPWPVSSPMRESYMTPGLKDTSSNEATPVPATVIPPFLEPKTHSIPPPPALARMGPLPTPVMTPASVASNTPAASACSSRRSSMTSAMSYATRMGLNRCSIDQHPGQHSPFPSICPRRAYQDRVSVSSPESMVTDRSASSRASSISSASSVTAEPVPSLLALGRACLARQATCRNAGLPVPVREEKANSLRPSIVPEDTDLTSSPETINFSVNGKAVPTPRRHGKHALTTGHHSGAIPEKSRKRSCPRGGRRSNLQEEVRILLEEEFDPTMDIDDRESVDSSPSPVGPKKEAAYFPLPATNSYVPDMKRIKARHESDGRFEREHFLTHAAAMASNVGIPTRFLQGYCRNPSEVAALNPQDSWRPQEPLSGFPSCK